MNREEGRTRRNHPWKFQNTPGEKREGREEGGRGRGGEEREEYFDEKGNERMGVGMENYLNGGEGCSVGGKTERESERGGDWKRSWGKELKREERKKKKKKNLMKKESFLIIRSFLFWRKRT